MDMSASLPLALGESVLAPSGKRKGKESWWVRQGEARQGDAVIGTEVSQSSKVSKIACPDRLLCHQAGGAVRLLMRLSLAPQAPGVRAVYPLSLIHI